MKLSINSFRPLSVIAEQVAAANITTHDYLAIVFAPDIKSNIRNSESIEEIKFKCSVFVNQLTRKYGNPPEGCSFFIMENTYDIGTSYRIAISYKMDKARAVNYANAVQFGCDIWDYISQEQLQHADFYSYSKQILQCA